MPVAGRDIIRRVLNWVRGALFGRALAADAATRVHVVPALFAVRPLVNLPAFRGLLKASEEKSARDFGLAARLRAVAVQNAPKALKGPRRKATPPAGKVIPKRAPRLLRRYKRASGTAIMKPWMTGASRVAARVAHAANVIAFVASTAGEASRPAPSKYAAAANKQAA